MNAANGVWHNSAARPSETLSSRYSSSASSLAASSERFRCSKLATLSSSEGNFTSTVSISQNYRTRGGLSCLIEQRCLVIKVDLADRTEGEVVVAQKIFRLDTGKNEHFRNLTERQGLLAIAL